jgi:cation transport ATPase
LDWRVPLRIGDGSSAAARAAELVGEQRWPPPPDAGLWWLVTAGAAALPFALAAWGSRSAGRRPGMRDPRNPATRPAESSDSPGGGTAVARWALAVTTVVVMGAHVVHMYGSALVVAEGRLVWVFLAAAGFAVVGWPIGAAGAWLTARGRAAGPLLCLVAGALLAIIIAPADVFSFHDAVIPFAWGADLDRLLIALTVGGGLGVVAAAWLLMRRTAPAAP